MRPEDFDDILRSTMRDGILSGSEKRALLELLAEDRADEQKLSYYRHRAFELASFAMVDPQSKSLIGWLEEVVKILTPNADQSPRQLSEAYFSPFDDCVGRIQALLDNARRSVDICVFTITDDRIASAIVAAHRRQVEIRVITDNEKAFDLGSDIHHLQQSGVSVLVDQTHHHMHHKFAIFDNSVLLSGSYNWTRGAAMNNDENFIVTSDPRLLSAFAKVFERLWKNLG